jgi:hypothetical protein
MVIEIVAIPFSVHIFDSGRLRSIRKSLSDEDLPKEISRDSRQCAGLRSAWHALAAVAVIERETRVILRYCWKKKRGQFIELAKKNMVLLGRLVGIEVEPHIDAS